MTDPGAPKTTSKLVTPGLFSADSPPMGSPQIPLLEYLALRKVPWSLAYVGFLSFVVVNTTYITKTGTAAMALALFALFLGSRRTRWPVPVRLLLIFWIWTALATTLSNYSGDLDSLIDLGKIILVFLVAVNVLWDRLALRLFILIYLACFTFFPARGTLTNYFIYENADFGRPSWVNLFGNPNDMAALTILALALAAGFLHKETPRALRFAALLLCMVFPFIVLLTQSRAAFIGTCVFLLLSVLSIGRNRIWAILAFAIIVTVVVAAAPPAVWERIAGLQNAASTETIAKMDPEGSAAERWDILQTAFRIVEDHPFVGVGRGRSQAALGVYNPKVGPKSLHNTYFEVLAETGAPGLILFLWILTLLLFRAWNSRRKARALRDSADWRRLQLLEFGLCGYLVAGIWGTYGFLSLLYVYLAILFAQAEVLDTLAQETSTGTVGSIPVKTKV